MRPGQAKSVLFKRIAIYISVITAVFVFSIPAPGKTIKAPVLKEIGAFCTGGNVQSVTIKDSCAYISDFYRGLYIVDISDPANPIQLSYAESFGFSPTAITDNFLITSSPDPFLSIFNIGKPQNPILISQDSIKGYPMRIHVEGSYAYIIIRKSGLLIYDISNIKAPKLVNNFNTPGSISDMTINGHYVYLADGHNKEDKSMFTGGFYIIDLNQPCNLKLTGQSDIGAHIQGICLSGRYCFLAAGDSGIYIMDIKKPDKPKKVSRIRTPSYAFNVNIDDDFMYVTQGGEGIVVYDIENINRPKLLAEFKIDGLILKVVKVGKYLYLAAGKAGMIVVESE
jgi:hypothetical protein